MNDTMQRTLGFLAAGLAGALIALLALTFATGTFAQGPNGQPAQATPSAGTMPGRGPMMGRGQFGGPEESLVGMAAAELKLTQAELIAKLGTDGTIAAALTAGGIDPAAFIDRFVASRAARLDAAVAAGTLTRAQADAQLANARAMATTRINQPFTVRGPGGQGAGAGTGAGQSFADADGDGVCDQMPAGGQGGQGHMGGGRGPRR